MKKFVALMLSLVLVLSAVSAFAAGSKTQSDVATTKVETATEEEAAPIVSVYVDETEETAALREAFAAALASGDILSVFPEDVQAQIPEGYATINEVKSYLLDNIPEGTTTLTIKYVFDTLYPAGEKVIVAYGIPSGTETVWVLAEGTAQEDGSVNVTLTEDQAEKIAGKVVTLVVISK